MEQLARPAGGARRVVAGFRQTHAQSAGDRVECTAGANDTAANDEDVKFGAGQLAQRSSPASRAQHRGRVRHVFSLPLSSRMSARPPCASWHSRTHAVRRSTAVPIAAIPASSRANAFCARPEAHGKASRVCGAQRRCLSDNGPAHGDTENVRLKLHA